MERINFVRGMMKSNNQWNNSFGHMILLWMEILNKILFSLINQILWTQESKFATLAWTPTTALKWTTTSNSSCSSYPTIKPKSRWRELPQPTVQTPGNISSNHYLPISQDTQSMTTNSPPLTTPPDTSRKSSSSIGAPKSRTLN